MRLLVLSLWAAFFVPSLLLPLAAPAMAQEFEEEEDEIETDRDAFTRSPRLVGLGRFVFEGSYTFLDQDAEHEGHLFPDLLVRYGLCEGIELRGGWNYEVGKYHQLLHAGAPRAEEGIAIYGTKLRTTTACGWVPDSSLILSGYTPTSGESNDTDFSMEYVVGWRLPCEMELESQIRWFSLAEEHDHFTEWAPSIVLKKSVLCGHAKAHVEYFSLLSRDREEDYRQHYVGPGIHFLLNADTEIGVRVFWGMGDDSAEFISNVGMGYRY